MIVLSGASASGKTEVAKMLAKKYHITKVITTTTRSIRVNELDGRDYFFVSEKRFQEMIKEERFVEYTVYNGAHYGSTKDQIADDKCIVIDPAGLKSYIALGNKTVVTFFLESLEETRHKRMLERGDSLEKIASRLANDRQIFKKENIPATDYIVDSETKNVEEVADEIYRLYINHSK